MRFIHTADWHLGRIFYQVQLIQDQDYILEHLVSVVRDSKPDFVAVAGDVYDRAVPPREAVKLLDDVLTRIVLGLNVPVVLIAGNHDSPERIGFCSRVLSERGLHVVGSISEDPCCITFHDSHGPVHVYALPYAEPPVVRETLGFEDIGDHNSACHALVDLLNNARPDDERSILLAHAFVSGGEESESERPLSVGGAGAVDADVFFGFSYTALGHLHRRQQAGARIHYSGSLMKYSFSEEKHEKSVTLVEMDGAGHCTTEYIPLTPLRNVRCMKGTLNDILLGSRDDDHVDDYLMVTLEDRGPVLSPMERLREVYPNMLHIERSFSVQPGEMQRLDADHRTKSERDLFSAFFQQVTGESLTEDDIRAFDFVVEKLRRTERETGA